MEKQLLSHDEMLKILNSLKNNNFKREFSTDMDGTHQEIIFVDDEGDCIEVRAGYDCDGCKHSVEFPTFIYQYDIGEYVIVVEQSLGGDICISLDNQDCTLDVRDSVYEGIENFISNDIHKYDEFDAFDHVDWAEWTEDELYDEIIEGLEYDEYIFVDDNYIGDPEIQEDYSDEPKLTRQEVARALAKNGCPDPW